jgi:hypothetical protein
VTPQSNKGCDPIDIFATERVAAGSDQRILRLEPSR